MSEKRRPDIVKIAVKKSISLRLSAILKTSKEKAIREFLEDIREAGHETILAEDLANAEALFMLYFLSQSAVWVMEHDESGVSNALQSLSQIQRKPMNVIQGFFMPTKESIHTVMQTVKMETRAPNETFYEGVYEWILLSYDAHRRMTEKKR